VALFLEMPRGRAEKVNDARFEATSRMWVVIVWSEGGAREEAAVAYAATVSAITGGVVGLKRKPRRGEARPLAREHTTTVLAVGRKHAVGATATQACHTQGGASPVQQRDTAPQKWNARPPAVLVQAASLQDVVHRINEWCSTFAVVIIAHHSVNVTTVTHSNVMLYLCEDDSDECLGSERSSCGLGRRGRKATLTSAMSSA
jgi:hypothetical protein